MLLDTNVLSELMRAKPAAEVLNWFGRQQNASYFVSVITCAEILLGIALLPAGKRRDSLALAAELMFKEDFAGRTLPFSGKRAAEYALLVAERIRCACVAAELLDYRAKALIDEQVGRARIARRIFVFGRWPADIAKPADWLEEQD